MIYPAEQRWFAMNVAPLEGTKGGVVTSHLDITRRRRAEMAVQKGGATMQALLDSAHAVHRGSGPGRKVCAR